MMKSYRPRRAADTSENGSPRSNAPLPDGLITEGASQNSGQADTKPPVSAEGEATISDKDRSRFESKVERSKGVDACHPYTGSIKAGYGRFTVGNREFQAHRVAWVLANGRAISANLEIHHECANRPCCNPRHLKAVTHAANMREVELCSHTPAERGKGRGCHNCFSDRHYAHMSGRETQPLPHDLGVTFLEWVWTTGTRDLGRIPSSIESSDRKRIGTFLAGYGERAACLSLWCAMRYWSKFTVFAATQYGAFYRDSDRAPDRPTLALMLKYHEAVVNYWNERDPTQVARRRAARDAAWAAQEEALYQRHSCPG